MIPTLIGAVIGALLGELEYALLGALIGLSFAHWQTNLALRERQQQIEQRLQALEDRTPDSTATDTRTSPGDEAAEQNPAQAPEVNVTEGTTAATAASHPPAPEDDPWLAVRAMAVATDTTVAQDSDQQTPAPPMADTIAPVEIAEPTPSPWEQQPAPAEPNPLLSWFTRGNTLVRVGIVILFFGVAFLLKYTVQHTHVPIELRLLGVALGGAALFGLGWRLRRSRPAYALALQGGGVGILYLTVFAAFRLHAVMDAGLAFGLLALLGAAAAALAVVNDSRALAWLASTGGFLAPLLASTGQGSHVELFSYYALLNLGIFAIAWFKAWRDLNLAGFLFTFAIGALWGAQYYRPHNFASTEPFLIGFSLQYVAISILFALRQPPRLRGFVDATLVFGTPLVSFALQSQLVAAYQHGLAWSAAVAGVFYLLLWQALQRGGRRHTGLLAEAFLALGIGFLTLTIPLAFDGRWTAAAWALEGAAMVWIGQRQARPLASLAGVLLQFAAAAALWWDMPTAGTGLPVFNAFHLACLTLATAGLLCAAQLRRAASGLPAAAAGLLLPWGLFWWYGGGLAEILARTSTYTVFSLLLFFSGSAVASQWLGQKLHWRALRNTTLGLLPVLMLIALLQAVDENAPLGHGGWLAWPLALATHLWILYRQQPAARTWWHAGGLWLLTGLLCLQFDWLLTQYLSAFHGSWRMVVWGALPAAMILAVCLGSQRPSWPLQRHRRAYLHTALIPLALYLSAWTLYANIHGDGSNPPLDYLPLLNPLDLALGLVLGGLCYWLRQLDDGSGEGLDWRLGYRVLGLLAFIDLNGLLARTVHQWAGTSYTANALLSSALMQTTLSIAWTLTSLLLIHFSSRLQRRPLWLTGAALLGVVVIKLFTIDLASSGTIQRIISFIVVGLLILAIGYLSPVPEKEATEDSTA